MPYDFTRYASELVNVIQRSARPGWRPESPARMYLEHAYNAGFAAGMGHALATVTAEVERAQPARDDHA